LRHGKRRAILKSSPAVHTAFGETALKEFFAQLQKFNAACNFSAEMLRIKSSQAN
jgi:hypothetical protein